MSLHDITKRQTDTSKIARINNNDVFQLTTRVLNTILLAVGAFLGVEVYKSTTEIRTSMARTEAELGALTNRMNFIGSYVGRMDDRTAAIDNKVNELNGRVSKIEGREEAKKR